ncbi:Transient receptor potential cation channel protein [Nesidiocoris tenuis]|nr:Transient receptor potential cation channel protein [Nesidiocoris tenuis]
MKRPGSGFFQNDPYQDLVQAMRFDDENKFNRILTTENVNVNKVYEKGAFYGTLLDLCCMEKYKSNYIGALLNRGANPNLINGRTKKGPIHQVAINEDAESMTALLDHKDTDPNLLDNFGSTAIHYACKNNDLKTIQAILNRTDVNLNIANRKGKTPLHVILDKEPSSEYLDVLRLLLSSSKIDLSLTDSDDVSLEQLLAEAYPDLMEGYPVAGVTPAGSNVDASHLFQLLRRNNHQQFLEHVKGNRDVLEGNDGSYTFMQYCCDYGIVDAVRLLLDEGVSPNTTCSVNAWPPIMIACRKGYVSIVKMLVNCKRTSFQPVNGETVLHCLVNGGYEKRALSEANIERNHLKCLSYVLEKVPRGKLDVNHRDKNGNTALHYAAKAGDQNIILEILNAGAYIGVCNKSSEPACADILQSTMERHLDTCIYSNGKMPRDETYALIFNYKNLTPHKPTQEQYVANSNDHFIEAPLHSYSGETMHKNGETDPLIYMSKNYELRPLLTHPIFTSYLHLKWHKIKPYFYMNLLFYTLFWAFLTCYTLLFYINSSPDNRYSNSTDNEVTILDEPSASSYFIWALVLVSLVLLILRESLQLIISPLKYVTNPENWLELAIILVTGVILFCGTCTSIRHQVSAISILLSWAELVLLIGKHPSLSTNIEMLKTVSWNFLKFLAWYSILIVAFALCFYSLFKDAQDDDNQFQHAGVSIFKTVVMLTGEFDTGSIPFLLYPVTSHILFVLFVFLIAIVLFNLLNGLAVSDTQAIKADAELVGYISQAKLISHIEEKCSNAFDCWGLFPKNTKFSNKINMFQDIPDGKIEIYPNNGNKVEMEESSFIKNRKRPDGESCYEIRSIFMDPRIIKTARSIMFKCENEKSKEDYFASLTDKENEIRELLNDFKECLRQYKEINSKLGL